MEQIDSRLKLEVPELTVGEKYTILYMSEWGIGAHALQVKLTRPIENRSYAQYKQSLWVYFKRKRCQKEERLVFPHQYDIESDRVCVIYPGWVEINTEIFGNAEKQGNFTVRRAKHSAFSRNYLHDAMASTNVKPIYVKGLAK